MKFKYIAIVVAAIVCVYGSVTVKSQLVTQNIIVSGKINKENYLLGESVLINFEVINRGNTAVQIPKLWAENAVYISPDGKNYRKTSRGKWELMLVNIPKITLEPEQSYTYEDIRIVSGGQKSDYSHLNPKAAKKQSEINDKIDTEYAFPKAGKYYIKGVFGTIESEPIQITIEEPQGEDLEVWNKIKDDGNFAYFIQEGEVLIPNYKPKERAEFKRKVEDIINQYPNSFYVQSLNQSLDKFKANEAKRIAFEEKIKANKP